LYVVIITEDTRYDLDLGAGTGTHHPGILRQHVFVKPLGDKRLSRRALPSGADGSKNFRLHDDPH
jgi:hypothetical protein